MKKVIKIDWKDFIKLRKVYTIDEILKFIEKVQAK